MAAVVFRGRNGNSALLVNLLKRVLPYRRRSVSNTLFYSTESATSRSEVFSLRYLEGKHEGTVPYYTMAVSLVIGPFHSIYTAPVDGFLNVFLQENRNFVPWENTMKMPTHYSFQTHRDYNDLQFEEKYLLQK